MLEDLSLLPRLGEDGNGGRSMGSDRENEIEIRKGKQHSANEEMWMSVQRLRSRSW